MIKRPFAKSIDYFEKQVEKAEIANIFCLTLSLLLIFLIVNTLIEILIIQKPAHENPFLNFILTAGFVFFLIFMCRYFFFSLKRLTRVFGRYNIYGLAFNLPEELKEKELDTLDYLWVRSVCVEYPHLRVRLTELKNENGNHTYNVMQRLWYEVMRLDNAKREEVLKKNIENQFMQEDHLKFHDLFWGVRYYKIEMDIKPILGAGMLSLLLCLQINKISLRELAPFLQFFDSSAIKLILALTSIFLLAIYYFKNMKENSMISKSDESLPMFVDAQFRQKGRPRDEKSIQK